jgi:Protein of unknown function (DUF1573)
MKRIAVLIFGVLVAAAALAQTSTVPPAQKTNGAMITWEKPTHDFGEITQGDIVEHTFKFTNTGTEPLIITNVQVTCGCTLPKEWPRDPVAVGGKGEITISFNSTGKEGKQLKVITIVSNAVNTDAGSVNFTTTVVKKNITPQ